MAKHPKVASWDVQRIAGEARIETRTARRVLVGDPSCKPSSRQLVVDAIARLNLAIEVPGFDESGRSRVRAT